MNIALPILLLIFGALTFWLLAESSLRWYFKTACITAFCVFTVIFWTTIFSFLGWPADSDDLPDKILIHWVVIKEPNKITESEGGIYILAEALKQEQKGISKIFGYKKRKGEPRLYGLPYDRNLHEELNKGVRAKLKKGQPVVGSIRKKGELGKSKKKGKGSEKGKKGGGSESQKQQWEFHELRPSDFLEKDS